MHLWGTDENGLLTNAHVKLPMKYALALLLSLYLGSAAAEPASVNQKDPRLEPAKVTVVPASPQGPAAIYIDGYIHRPTVDAIAHVANLGVGGPVLIYFNSPGGDLVASIELGQVIRAKGYSTRVGRKGPSGSPLPGRCESGCPFAFAGGKFRFLESSSSMGVHQFYRASGARDGDLSLGQVASALVATHLSNMGVSVRLMNLAASAGSDAMHYLTPVEAFDLGLINAGANPAHWEVRDLAGALVLVGEQDTIQGTGRIALACGRNNTMELAGLFKMSGDQPHMPSFDHAEVQVDDLPTGTPAARVRFRNGYMSFLTIPNSKFENALSSASAVTLRFTSNVPGQAIEFRLVTGDGLPLVRSFIRLCGGARPSLGDSL